MTAKIAPQSFSLYTVIVDFNDFTQGIEQYGASSPQAAMALFLREAACLGAMPRELRDGIGERDIVLVPIRTCDGVWLWVRAQSQVPGMASVLGGQVIRTAPTASNKPKAARG